MPPDLSVAICTHNPHGPYLRRVLESLRMQTLGLHAWELLIIDNASRTAVATQHDLGWHPAGRHIHEPALGLTHARFRAIEEARGGLIVFVDDDNLLDAAYLENALRLSRDHAAVGLFGGKSLPEYEAEPPAWIRDFWGCLALRDLGDRPIVSELHRQGGAGKPDAYPACAPIGAGMTIRRSVARQYKDTVIGQAARQSLGRRGTALTSGEDNDMILEAMRQGHEVGYFPELTLTHIMPAKRLTSRYLARLNFASSKSWMQVLHLHGICPWPRISRHTVGLRKAKAYLAYRAWRSDLAYIRWKGACGMYEGLSAVNDTA